MKIIMYGFGILLLCFVATTNYTYADDKSWENNTSNGHHNPVLSTAPRIVEISWYLEKGFKPPPGAIEEGDCISMSFSLPSDCSRIQLFSDLEPCFTYNLSDLFGAWAYCERVNKLNKGSSTAKYDYVSDLDYTSLPLDLIPIELQCIGVMGGDLLTYCDNINIDPQFNKLSYAHFRLTKTPLPVDRETCHLYDSKFIGQRIVKDGKVVCSMNEGDGEGIELYDCHFRDMNHDGYMDAVLSFITRGAGADGRFTFILTRLKENGPLLNIDNLDANRDKSISSSAHEPMIYDDAWKTLTERELTERIQRPVLNINNGEPFNFKVVDKNDNEVGRVNTPTEYYKHIRAGNSLYLYTTYDIIDGGLFRGVAMPLLYLSKAKQSKHSYVRDFPFDSKDPLSVLPAEFVSWNGSDQREIVERASAENKPWRRIAPNARILTSTSSDLRIYDTFHEDLYNLPDEERYDGDQASHIMRPVVLGDLNNDGYEDIVLSSAFYYVGGSGRYYYFVVLTRKSPNDILKDITDEVDKLIWK